MNADAAVLVFARAPLPGRTKTRLVPGLGAWGAARLQARLTERALRTWLLGTIEYRLCLRGLAQQLGRAVTPDDVEPFLWTVADPHGPRVDAEDFLEAAEWQQGWATRVASWWPSGWHDEHDTQRRALIGLWAVLNRILPCTHSFDLGGSHTLTVASFRMSALWTVTAKSRKL